MRLESNLVGRAQRALGALAILAALSAPAPAAWSDPSSFHPPEKSDLRAPTCKPAAWLPNGTHGVTCCQGGGGSCLVKECPKGLHVEAGWNWVYTGQRRCIN